MREGLLNSIKIGLVAAAVAVVLGTLASFAVHRFRFFGRETVSFALVLPIALPGIITGMALRSAMNTTGVNFSLWTIMIGHATFCVVVVFNNVIARLRRTSGSIVEASMDLGADGWQTFRLRDAAVDLARRWSPVVCSPSRCRSTRSSSRTSCPGPS